MSVCNMCWQATSPGKRQGRGAKPSQRSKSRASGGDRAHSTKTSLSDVFEILGEARKEVQEGTAKLRADLKAQFEVSNAQQKQSREDMEAANAENNLNARRMEKRMDNLMKLMGGKDSDSE